MRANFKPTTRLGKWAVRFGAASLSLYLSSIILAALSQQKVGEEIIINSAIRPILIAFGILAAILGLSAFFTGIVSLVKYRERAILIYIAVFIGFQFLFILIGEFLFPH